MKKKIALENGYRIMQIIDLPKVKEPIYKEDTIINDFSNYQSKNDAQLYNVIEHLSKILKFNINNIDFNKVKEYANKYSHGEIPVENSVAYNYPTLIKEFYEELNPGINLYNLSKGSNKTLYWKCTKCNYGHNGEWRTSIKNRTHNTIILNQT